MSTNEDIIIIFPMNCILRRTPFLAIHWKRFHLRFQKRDVKTIRPFAHRANA